MSALYFNWCIAWLVFGGKSAGLLCLLDLKDERFLLMQSRHKLILLYTTKIMFSTYITRWKTSFSCNIFLDGVIVLGRWEEENNFQHLYLLL